jgi:hypothetical protein
MGALCGASEYDELPVRHNEDQLNLGLSKEVSTSSFGLQKCGMLREMLPL